MNTRKAIEFIVWCAVAAVLIAHARGAAAQTTVAPVPALMHYQAQVATPEGIHVDGDVAVQVFLYDSPTLGVHGDPADEHVLYAEDQGLVHVDRGTLRMSIGQGAGLGQFAGAQLPLEAMAEAQDLYVELIIDGEVVAPRQRVGFRNAAMHAQYARVAGQLDGELRLNANNLPDEFDADKASEDDLHIARIPPLDATKIASGEVNSGLLQSDIPLSKITTGQIASDLLPGISAGKIISGEFGAARLPPTIMPEGNVGVFAGRAHHGALIQLPPGGFVDTDCAWLVAYYNDDEEIDIHNTIDNIDVFSGTDPITNSYSRIITCEISKNDGQLETCDVNYLVVCVK